MANFNIKAYYTAPFAPNPMIVDIFAREKGVDIEKMEAAVDLLGGANRTGDSLQKNKAGQLPYFELNDGTIIAETIAMCEYLEDLQPSPALIGATPAEKAVTRMWQRRMDEHYVLPSFNAFRSWTASDDCEGGFKDFFKDRCVPEKGGVLIPSVYKDLQSQCKGRLGWVEAQKKESPSDFICGGKVTMVDIQVYCAMFFFADKSQPFLEENKANWPWWEGWFARMEQRDSVKACKAHIEALSKAG